MILNTQKRSFTTFIFWRRSENCRKLFQFWIPAQSREPSLIVLLFWKLEVCVCVFSKEPIVESFLLARILSKQKSPKAEEAWRALIEHNSDSYEYYRGYLKYLGIDDGAPILT